MQQHPSCTHAVRQNKKVQFITDSAQRVNAPYSLFHIETLWILTGSVSFYPAFCRHAEALVWRCRGGGRGREPVSLLPRKPRLAYLTPVLVTSQTGIVHSQLGILLKGWNLAAEMKVCCSSTHKESLFIVVLPLGGKTVLPFGFNYINKEVRQSLVA